MPKLNSTDCNGSSLPSAPIDRVLIVDCVADVATGVAAAAVDPPHAANTRLAKPTKPTTTTCFFMIANFS
jgi:hypothetical protein